MDEVASARVAITAQTGPGLTGPGRNGGANISNAPRASRWRSPHAASAALYGTSAACTQRVSDPLMIHGLHSSCINWAYEKCWNANGVSVYKGPARCDRDGLGSNERFPATCRLARLRRRSRGSDVPARNVASTGSPVGPCLPDRICPFSDGPCRGDRHHDLPLSAHSGIAHIICHLRAGPPRR
jgi:hypothetical protein